MAPARPSDPDPFSPSPASVVGEGSAETPRAGRVRELRAPGPGMVSALPGMLYLCRLDEAWTMDFVSPGARALTGYAPETFLPGGSIAYAEIIHPEDRDWVADEVARAVTEGRPFRMEYRIRTADGEERWVAEVGHSVRDPEGEVLGLEGFITDLTERRKLEAQVRHAQKMDAVGRLAGTLAHDFNNLLNVIGSNAQFLVEDLGEREGQESLRDQAVEVALASKRASDLVSQLLSFARERPYDLRACDVNDLVGEVRGLLDRLAGPGVSVALRLAPELPRVRADRGQFEQVLLNLIANARDALPEGGKVTVETMDLNLREKFVGTRVSLPAGRWVLVTVSDNGPGMDPEVADRVFEPFFTTKEAGTGLGLPSVFGIVTQHGGHVSIYSEPGSGTTVKIYLPAVEGLGAKGETDAVRETGSLHGTETVLLVEDDSVVKTMGAAILEQFGYRVLLASDAAAARSLARTDEEERIHLAVVDLVLEGKSGRRLAGELEELRMGLSVLLTSGYPWGSLVDRGVLEPETPFLQKPFTPRALLETVRDLLDREGAEEP